MKRVIINADDFGINEPQTAAIEKMIEAGSVSSTTVMANGLCLDEVRRFASQHPEVSFGVHLCLSEFSSLTKSEVLHQAGLTDENGDFIRLAVRHVPTLHDEKVRRAIKDELNAQIDVVSSLGFPISHADSHHHVHNIYSLREIFAELLQERGIKKIRHCAGFFTLRSKGHFIKWIRHERLQSFYSSRFITTDTFYSYDEFLVQGRPLGEGKVVELMCHPGHSSERYQKEMQMVAEKKAIKGDFKIISFNDLV